MAIGTYRNADDPCLNHCQVWREKGVPSHSGRMDGYRASSIWAVYGLDQSSSSQQGEREGEEEGKVGGAVVGMC